MLPPAAVKVLSGIAGIFVFGATAVGAVVSVFGIIMGGLMPMVGGNALLFLVAPSVVLSALVAVFIRFGWDLFSQFIKP